MGLDHTRRGGHENKSCRSPSRLWEVAGGVSGQGSPEPTGGSYVRVYVKPLAHAIVAAGKSDTGRAAGKAGRRPSLSDLGKAQFLSLRPSTDQARPAGIAEGRRLSLHPLTAAVHATSNLRPRQGAN